MKVPRKRLFPTLDGSSNVEQKLRVEILNLKKRHMEKEMEMFDHQIELMKLQALEKKMQMGLVDQSVVFEVPPIEDLEST